MSIIAIFSGIHSAGEEIAREVAKRLDYTFVGDDLLEAAAKEHGTTAAKLSRAMGKRAFFNKATHEWEKNQIYLKATLAQRLVKDDVVVHGSVTQFIPSTIGHVLKVGIVAESQFRIERAVTQKGVDPDQAAQYIERADTDTAQWIDECLSRSMWDAALYDLKIPVPETTIGDAVDVICENFTKDALRPTDKSIQAMLDFLLATKVNLALLEHGYYYCDVRAQGDEIAVVINKTPTAAGAFVRAIQLLRYEQAADKVKEICRGFDEVNRVETLPGKGYKRPERALLVDDEEEYVLTLSQRLEMRDISADVVHDGQGALSALGGEVPDVMVLDLKMPGLDGIEVLRRVKRDHPQVEVIILTGHGGEKDERTAMELGAYAFLTKPVDIDVLAETMREASRKAHGEN